MKEIWEQIRYLHQRWWYTCNLVQQPVPQTQGAAIWATDRSEDIDNSIEGTQPPHKASLIIYICISNLGHWMA